MKTLTVFLALYLCFSLTSCSKKKPEITVGMTYDEVEKALGKPEEITRGVSQLSTEEWSDTISAITNRLNSGEYSQGDLERPEAMVDISADSAARANGDTLVWLVPMNVQTTGQMLYVTWVYPVSRMDTFHIFQKAFGMQTDTLRRSVSVPSGKHLAQVDTTYFLNNYPTTAELYRHASVGDYWGPAFNLPMVKMVPHDHYYKTDLAIIISGVKKTQNTRTFMKAAGYSLVSGKHIETKEVYQTDYVSTTKEILRRNRVQKPSIKEYYAVYERYCVMFDASSGRLVSQGYQPILVTECR